MPTPHFKPTHQPIKEYYAALEAYRGHEVRHELAVKTAFQRLLEVTARKHDWHLIPEQPATVRGKSIRPGGTPSARPNPWPKILAEFSHPL